MEEDLNKKLEDCQKKAEEYLAGWQRARADFLNYKKEEMERIVELLNYGVEEMVLKILPILDNFEIAEKKLLNKDNEDVRGLLQIKNQLQDFLKNHGVEEIKSLGEKFDANLHEVVGPASVPLSGTTAGKEADTITEEVQRGYKINGRLLRPAKVKITK